MVIVLLLLQFAVFPFMEMKKSVNQAIRNNEKTVSEMLLMAAEYRGLKHNAENIRQIITRRPQDFNLFSYLEKIAGAAGVKSNIKNINTTKGSVSGPYEEVPVEIRLDKITSKQLTDFLYLLESPQELIRIKNITISKMKESPEYLTTQILVVMYQLSKVAGR